MDAQGLKTPTKPPTNVPERPPIPPRTLAAANISASDFSTSSPIVVRHADSQSQPTTPNIGNNTTVIFRQRSMAQITQSSPTPSHMNRAFEEELNDEDLESQSFLDDFNGTRCSETRTPKKKKSGCRRFAREKVFVHEPRPCDAYTTTSSAAISTSSASITSSDTLPSTDEGYTRIHAQSQSDEKAPNRSKPRRSLTLFNLCHVDNIPRSDFIRVFITFVYALVSTWLCTLTLQLTHERMNKAAMSTPLRDIAFDISPNRLSWALRLTEITGIVLVVLFLLMVFFHRQRLVILRRFLFTIGTLYNYRSILMYSTNLPIPGVHLRCAEKTHGDFGIMVGRATLLWLGGGLTLSGNHVFCGDYMFSGHTLIITTFYLFLNIYIPSTNRPLKVFHAVLAVASYTAITCILLGHDHYTIDVLIAYFFTTRLIYTYHSSVNLGLAAKEANLPSVQTAQPLQCMTATATDVESQEISDIYDDTNTTIQGEKQSKYIKLSNLRHHLFKWVWWWHIFLWLEAEQSQPGYTRCKLKPLLYCERDPQNNRRNNIKDV